MRDRDREAETERDRERERRQMNREREETNTQTDTSQQPSKGTASCALQSSHSPRGETDGQGWRDLPCEGRRLAPLLLRQVGGAPGCYLVLVRDAQLGGLQGVVPGDEAVDAVGLSSRNG